ncbi:CRISPR-associated endonuclease Cas2 [Rothia sp. P5766]|uniref:CRISPR-associated endonuclease Cas2 n=1 Tax=unclassified Rothia (in: high G+C Gram-positive bacteria) TaxID=2689056 RepID=UPI003AE759E8
MAKPVWLLVMFDLPVKTKTQMRLANQYRNLLKDRGFDRIQLSVYCKYYLNGNSTERDLGMLKVNVPVGGQVRVLRVSDNQWASTIMFVGPKQKKAEPPPEQLTIF